MQDGNVMGRKEESTVGADVLAIYTPDSIFSNIFAKSMSDVRHYLFILDQTEGAKKR